MGHATAQSLRISADELKTRLQAGEPVTVLDVRSPKAWDSSDATIRGAVRVPPEQFRVDPSWPRERLTVAY
jgi:rhodanese-related sulfurtransferase